MRHGAYHTTKRWAELDTSWMRVGSCADLPPRDRLMFFQDEKTSVAAKRDTLEAKQMCQSCPVEKQCLEFAIQADMCHVWGGTTLQERLVMQGKARVRKRAKGRNLQEVGRDLQTRVG